MSSSLIVEVCKIKNILPHDNADALEICVVKGWRCIAQKGYYKKGDMVVYIPPDSLLPTDFADELGVRTYLGGSNKDRVRSAKLRGVMSEGLIIDVPKDQNWKVGTDVKDHFGITKYVAPVRTMMADAAKDDPYFDKFTDIENIKNYPDIFTEGEEVVVLEKCDGTNSRTGCSVSPTIFSRFLPKLFSPKIVWKAGSHKVNRKKPSKEKMAGSIYWYPYTIKEVRDLLIETMKIYRYKNVILYGEIYGKVRGGMKSMHYGKLGELGYVAFGLKVDGKYMDWTCFYELCKKYNVKTVPILGIIPFNFDKIKELSEGDSVLAAENGVKHIREGVVVLPIKEREEKDIRRVILKLHGDSYLAMKNKKEKKGEEVDFADV